MKRGFFIGRFQPYHLGHQSVIKKASEEVDELIVAIGTTRVAYTKLNPFTLEERLKMIENDLKTTDIKCHIIPIPDINDYKGWVEHVESLCPKFDIVYSNSPITRKLFLDKGYKVKSVNIIKASATEIREKIYSGEEWENLVPTSTVRVIDKIKGEDRIINLIEQNKYDNPILTVDTIIKHNNNYVLIKRKKWPFEGMYALPGGHVETGESVEDAAVREAFEETGLKLKNLQLFSVYSEPNRDPRGSYVTVVFTAEGEGEIKAGDDASEVVLFDSIPALAFDHNKIVEDYIKKDGSGG